MTTLTPPSPISTAPEGPFDPRAAAQQTQFDRLAYGQPHHCPACNSIIDARDVSSRSIAPIGHPPRRRVLVNCDKCGRTHARDYIYYSGDPVAVTPSVLVEPDDAMSVDLMALSAQRRRDFPDVPLAPTAHPTPIDLRLDDLLEAAAKLERVAGQLRAWAYRTARWSHCREPERTTQAEAADDSELRRWEAEGGAPPASSDPVINAVEQALDAAEQSSAPSDLEHRRRYAEQQRTIDRSTSQLAEHQRSEPGRDWAE